LQAAAHELERQKVTDSLKKGLEKRPQREDLVERNSPSLLILKTKLTFSSQGNILPSSTAAPSIVGQQRELEKHMRADSLNEKISHRPKPEDLVKEGILTEDPTSPEEKTQAENDKLYEERIEEEYAKREGGA
jgi:hypothetical protein